MNKSLIVAASEFSTLVRTKAFLLTLMLMPVMGVAAVFLIKASARATDTIDRRFAYVDRTGIVGPVLQAAAQTRNATAAEEGIPKFLPVEIPPTGEIRTEDELRVELSDRVRSGELFAFVDIPADVTDPDVSREIQYYSDHPSYQGLPQWLRATIGQAILMERFRAAAVDPQVVARLTRPTPVTSLGLFERSAQGTIRGGEQVDAFRAQGVPAIMMVLMYMVIMASAPQLLNSVIEEKMSRISEVLIGSVSTFELMMGKLIGVAGTSLLLAATYVAGGLVLAQYYGYAGSVTPAMIVWCFLFLLLAVLLFGAMFIAIGAACTDLKDSQSMMTPVILFIMVPVFMWGSVLRAPDSTLSLVLSMLPTTSPFLMLLRIVLQPGPPLWQVVVSVLLMAGTTVAAVWAAGRIFRTGILMQGKSASFAEMIRWVRAG